MDNHISEYPGSSYCNGYNLTRARPVSLTSRKRQRSRHSPGPFDAPVHELLVLHEVTGKEKKDQGESPRRDLIVREDYLFKEEASAWDVEGDRGGDSGDKEEVDEEELTETEEEDRESVVTAAVLMIANVNVVEGGHDGGGVWGMRVKEQEDVGCVVKPTVDLQIWSRLGPQRAIEAIMRDLRNNYHAIDPRRSRKILYKCFVNPEVRLVKRTVFSLRTRCGPQRIAMHYSGPGAPHPVNNTLWFFDGSRRNYYRMSIQEFFINMQAPSIYIFDCINGGAIVNSFRSMVSGQGELASNADSNVLETLRRRCIIFCASDHANTLPVNSDLPGDLFTALMTSPLTTSLLWARSRSKLLDISPDDCFSLPGMLGNIEEPRGELNWIFMSIIDTIAYSTLSRPLYLKLFRSRDTFLTSMARNFLLATHVMKLNGCDTSSYPALPTTFHHPLWRTWETECRDRIVRCPLYKNLESGKKEYMTNLYEKRSPCRQNLLLTRSNKFEYTWGCNHSPRCCSYFEDQLAAFQVWLRSSSNHVKKPYLLPSVLNSMYSSRYRPEALKLISLYAQTGPAAADHLQVVGAPELLKRTILSHQSGHHEWVPDATFILAKILCVDRDTTEPSMAPLLGEIAPAVLDIYRTGIKDVSHQMDATYLISASFILTELAGLRHGSVITLEVLGLCESRVTHFDSTVRRWACLCYARLLKESRVLCQIVVDNSRSLGLFLDLVREDEASDVRTAGVSVLSCLVVHVLGGQNQDSPSNSPQSLSPPEQGAYLGSRSGAIAGMSEYGVKLLKKIALTLNIVLENDASPLVRREVAIMVTKWVELQQDAFVSLVEKKALPGSSDDGFTPHIVWSAVKSLSCDPHPLVSALARPCFDWISSEAKHHHLGERRATAPHMSASTSSREPPGLRDPVFLSPSEKSARRSQEAMPLHELHSSLPPKVEAKRDRTAELLGAGQGLTGNRSTLSSDSLESVGSRVFKQSSGKTLPARQAQERSNKSAVRTKAKKNLSSPSTTDTAHPVNPQTPPNENLLVEPTSFGSGLEIENSVRGLIRSVSSLFVAGNSSNDRPPAVKDRRTIEYSLQVDPGQSSPNASPTTSYPMNRTNSFPLLAVNTKVPIPSVSNYGKIVSSFSTFKRKQAEASFYEWSCAAISRMPRDSSLFGLKNCVDPLRDIGYRKYGFDYGLEGLNDPYTCIFGNFCSGEGDLEVSEADARADRTLEHSKKTLHMSVGAGAVTSLAFMPPGVGGSGSHLLVTGDSTGSIGVIDIVRRKGLHKMGIPAAKSVPPSPITAILSLGEFGDSGAQVPTGSYRPSPLFAAGAADGRVAIFRAKVAQDSYCVVGTFIASGNSKWRLLHGEEGHQYRPFSMISRMYGSFLMNDVKRETISAMKTGQKGLCLAYDDVLEQLVAGGCEGGIVRVWDLYHEACSWIGSVVEEGSFPTSVATAQDCANRLIAVGSSNGYIAMMDSRVYSPHRPEFSSYLEEGSRGPLKVGKQDAPIVSVAWSRYGGDHGNNILAGDVDGKVVVWDVRVSGRQNGEHIPLETIEAHKSPLTAMVTRPRSKVVATASCNRSVKIFGSTSQLLKNIESVPFEGSVQRLEPPSALAFHPTRSLFAIGTVQSTVMIYSPDI